jgi:uncharacterized protein YggE
MTGAPILAVRGEVVREVDPELASFSVNVSARDSDRRATLARLTQRHDALRAVLDEYAGAIERRETGVVSVYPEPKRTGERIRAYTGTISTRVTMTDFVLLGELMLRLADADQTAVYGPFWGLRQKSPVYREARRAAVGDAIARATEYAEALGARVTRLVELADAGLSAGQPQPMAFGMAPAGMMRGPGGPPQLELDPQRQTVRAQIEARFEITEPTAVG